MNEFELIRIAENDDVAVALRALKAGETCRGNGFAIQAAQDVPAGHKLALRALSAGENVKKYGAVIGRAIQRIAPGEWVHTHNLESCLGGAQDYEWQPEPTPEMPPLRRTFRGFLRADGRAGIRNGVWIVPTVGCVNRQAAMIAALTKAYAHGSVDAVTAFAHPLGCSQMAEDQETFRRSLAALIAHPNAGGVLVLGLGCENSGVEQLKPYLPEYDSARVRFLVAQDVEDEVAEGERIVRELIDFAAGDERTEISAEKLVVGLKCGGSDGFSGITANPAIGVCADLLVRCGGTPILTEVPEMFGAEDLLFARCDSRETFEQAVAMINGYKEHFRENGLAVDKNPSPGNHAGGITTLADKSLGCTQKSGASAVRGVIGYGEAVRKNGLHLLCAPGNDLVSSSGLAFAGAQLVLFSTGRGTPFSSPVPTVKIATNQEISARKARWIDFDASSVLRGVAVAEVGAQLFEKTLAIASGEETKGEAFGFDVAFWKRGVTL